MSFWFPPIDILIAILLLAVASSELSDWVKSRERGFRGSSQTFGKFVDFTAGVSGIAGFGVIIACIFVFGWRSALGVFVAGVAVLILWNIGLSQLAENEQRGKIRTVLWLLALALVWPLLIFLTMRLFG